MSYTTFNPDQEKMMATEKRRWLEITAVVATGVLKYIFMDWLNVRAFYIAAACIFWSLYIYRRFRKNNHILQYWGFRKKYFKQSFLFLMPFALIMIAAITWYGISHNAVLNWHIIPVFILYPAWGALQQFLMLALIAGNLHSITRINLGKIHIILLTSAVFALVHYPSLTLMVFTFFMELVFLIAYFKWKNLWAIALYHGWVASLLLFFVLNRDLWNELWTIL